MTRIRTVAIILILTLLIAPIFSFSAQAMLDGSNYTGPTPGTHKLYDPLRDYIPGTNETEDSINFINNDAYESGLLDEPYKFFASIWAGYANQRVAVSLFVDYGHDYAGQVDLSQNAIFTIYQKKEWVEEEWKDDNNTEHSMTVNVSWTQVGHYITGGYYIVDGYYANASFLTSSSDFYPGPFVVEVKIMCKEGVGTVYKKVAEIVGVFTPGRASVKDIHDASYWEPGEQPYTSATISFSEGMWSVKLWYSGKNFPPVNVGGGKVNEDGAYVVKNFGDYSGETVTLRYNFTDNDPGGIYVWIITSHYQSSILTSYSWTVYNNQTVLENGTNHPPTVTVNRKGEFKQGLGVDFLIKATDDHSSKIRIWVVAWFGDNMYQMPDPSTDLIVANFKPFEVENGGTADWHVTLNYYGNINLNIFAVDENGALNITRVQYYVDKASGGGYIINSLPSWLQMPWDDTIHLILFVAGLMMVLFAKDPLLRIIGLALIAISFVDFSYIQSWYQAHEPHLGVII